jgi:hypothetical protein
VVSGLALSAATAAVIRSLTAQYVLDTRILPVDKCPGLGNYEDDGLACPVLDTNHDAALHAADALDALGGEARKLLCRIEWAELCLRQVASNSVRAELARFQIRRVLAATQHVDIGLQEAAFAMRYGWYDGPHGGAAASLAERWRQV